MSDQRIVVGIDGSDGGRRALRWAVHEAAARGCVVQAVISWRWDDVEFRPHASTDPDLERRRAERTLHDELTALGEPSVPISAEVVEGRAADVLCEAARDADLLVLGSHGTGRIRHTVLGSVSEECVHHASCPVVIIPVADQQRGRAGDLAIST